MFWPSCSLGPVQACQTDMSWMSFPAILSWLSCSLLSYPNWPVQPCSGRPIISFLSWLSCHGCRVPNVLSGRPVPVVLAQHFSSQVSCPRCHVLVGIFRQSCPICPVPDAFPLVPCSDCHRTIVLCLMSCLGYTRLSLQNCPMRIDFKN
jgi:hypothetical protein